MDDWRRIVYVTIVASTIAVLGLGLIVFMFYIPEFFK